MFFFQLTLIDKQTKLLYEKIEKQINLKRLYRVSQKGMDFCFGDPVADKPL